MAALSPFRTVLEQRRDTYNARFRQARHRSRALDPGEFLDHLRTVVGPVVDALPAGADPLPVADALVELSLELAARGRLSGTVADGFGRVLPAATGFVAARPRQVPAAVANAMHHLSVSPTGDPAGWAATMAGLAPVAATVDEWLAAGAVAAWRRGLAQLRPAALTTARTLPAPLLSAALGSAVEGEVVDRLAEDPWLDPPLAARTARVLVPARWVGAFRGFGGTFRRPPTVCTAQGRWYAGDGEGAWRVFADRFGVSLRRVPGVPESRDRPGALRLDAGGRVTDTTTGAELDLPELADATSWASTGGTLAATTRWTHGILFVARTAG